jgi:hypothetical protein
MFDFFKFYFKKEKEDEREEKKKKKNEKEPILDPNNKHARNFFTLGTKSNK